MGLYYTREVSAVDRDKIEEIEANIAELRSRWPPHSVPPAMWDELDELERQLDEARGSGEEADDAG